MARFLLGVAVVAGAVLAVAVAPAGGGGGGPGGGGAEPAGRVLFVTGGNRLTSVDVATGRKVTRRVSVASCGPSVYVTGGHVVFGVLRKRRTVVSSVPVELDRAPRRLGSAHAFVPSAVDGRVWLAGTRCTTKRMVGVREVTVDGRVTARSPRRVRGWLAGAVEGRPVLHRSGSVFSWDPASGRRGRDLGVTWLSGTHGNRIAGCTRGTRCRGLSVVDAATGRARSIRIDAPWKLGGTAHFSPDGALVATPVATSGRWAVATAGADDGRLSIVPGSGGRGTYPETAWSRSSGWLFFRASRGRVLAYLPGEDRAVRLPFRLPRDAVNFMAG